MFFPAQISYNIERTGDFRAIKGRLAICHFHTHESRATHPPFFSCFLNWAGGGLVCVCGGRGGVLNIYHCLAEMGRPKPNATYSSKSKRIERIQTSPANPQRSNLPSFSDLWCYLDFTWFVFNVRVQRAKIEKIAHNKSRPSAKESKNEKSSEIKLKKRWI